MGTHRPSKSGQDFRKRADGGWHNIDVTALLLAVLAQVAAPPLDRAADFAGALETAVAKGDTLTLDLALDPDAFFDRVVGATKLTPATVDFFKPMIRMTFASSQIFAVVKPPMAWKFLRVRKADDGIRALFRMTGAGGAFHYHEYLLAGEPPSFRIVDYHVLNFGGFQSEMTRRSLMPSPEALKVLNMLQAPTPGDFMMDFKENLLNRLSNLYTAGEYRKALDLFYEKPATFKTIRIAQVLHINAARMIDQPTHQKAIDDMQEFFKDDPAISIASFGGYMRFKQKDRALEAVNLIDKAVGGDIFLNVTRASIHYECDEPAKALDLARIVTEKEPSLAHGWWTLLGAQLTLKKYQDLAHSLTLAEKHLGMDFGDLKDVDVYADFTKSPEYAEWMKSRAPK